MGADEVAYHRSTVLDRSDDHPGAALAYYGSRGETPLRWAGAGAARLGLSGEVTPGGYDLAFGPGGFRHPETGERLRGGARGQGSSWSCRAHKSVAVLGVMDRADEMHSILDVETTATMDWLDGWFAERGGRRGRVQERTATGGLVYAVTRHATSRAGDPSPHDHVLVANVVEMLDARGGFKGLDSAALRDTVEAATMVGRLHSAARAVELGFRIEADDGPSGNLRHWRVAGDPRVGVRGVLEALRRDPRPPREDRPERLSGAWPRGPGDPEREASHRSRGAAAPVAGRTRRGGMADRTARRPPRANGTSAGTSNGRSRGNSGRNGTRGRSGGRLVGHGTSDGRSAGGPGPARLSEREVDVLVREVLDVDGRLLANRKVFTRTNLVADVAPRLYGRDPAELDRVLARIVGSGRVVPLIGVAGAREQSYTTVEVLMAEATIAETVERLATRPGPAVAEHHVTDAVSAAEEARGYALTAGQRRAVEQLCTGNAGVSVVVGVAGSGKTTALDTASTILEQAGYRVLGTSTSGQAARTLATEAGVEARTFQSMLWRLDHGQITLDDRTVVVVDEAGMADDANLARLVLAVERPGASLVLVGDHRQLDAVGPGGALAALLERHPDLVVTLGENVRQHDPGERQALAMLRNGDPADAVAWYADQGRIQVQPTRVETLVAMTDAWAADTRRWTRHGAARVAAPGRRRPEPTGRGTGGTASADSTVTTSKSIPAAGTRRGTGWSRSRPTRRPGSSPANRSRSSPSTEGAMTVRTSDDRSVTPRQVTRLDADHLDHGYALTVHRAQGATYDRAHVLAAGGGRELAYVAIEPRPRPHHHPRHRGRPRPSRRRPPCRLGCRPSATLDQRHSHSARPRARTRSRFAPSVTRTRAGAGVNGRAATCSA